LAAATNAGNLGALMAEWLAQHSVQHVVLASRSGKLPPEAAVKLLAAGSAAHSSCITVSSCDLGCAEDVSSLLPADQPVSCFMHAGGVLADATLANQSLAGLRAVMAPKAVSLGRWQAVMGAQPLLSQLLFSSVAALLGAPGQANYSAANSILDGAAGVMQAQGMPAVSVQWGAWAGAGMAAQDAQTAARVERMGMAMIQPQRGLAALEGLLSAMQAQQQVPAVLAVNGFMWQRFLARLPPSAPPGLFEQQAAAAGAGVSAAGLPSTRGPAVSAAFIQQRVSEAVSAVVGHSVAADASLMEAGLDSLGAVELRHVVAVWAAASVHGKARCMHAAMLLPAAQQAQQLKPCRRYPPLSCAFCVKHNEHAWAVSCRNALSTSFRLELPATLTFDYPTVSAIAGFIAATATPTGTPAASTQVACSCSPRTTPLTPAGLCHAAPAPSLWSPTVCAPNAGPAMPDTGAVALPRPDGEPAQGRLQAPAVGDAIVISGLSLRCAGSSSLEELMVHMRDSTELHTVAPYAR
jgi:hypothetical protein